MNHSYDAWLSNEPDPHEFCVQCPGCGECLSCARCRCDDVGAFVPKPRRVEPSGAVVLLDESEIPF